MRHAGRSPKVHRDTRKSHVSPKARDTRKGGCLDCSSLPTTARMTSMIFSLPAMALMGTLTGFDEPQGMCSDKAGNIWITNTGTLQIFQYSRTGTLLKTLSDTNGYPVGCAVNKPNGDLAVTNIIGYPSGDGTVDVYANATGTPTVYSSPSQTENFFDAYDSSGNLYVDGFGDSGFSLSKLPNGSSTMSTIILAAELLAFPGGVNWRPRPAWSLATKSAALGLARMRSRFPARPERSPTRRRSSTPTAENATSIKLRSLRLESFCRRMHHGFIGSEHRRTLERIRLAACRPTSVPAFQSQSAQPSATSSCWQPKP
jgi:hypothetical protein